MADRFTDSDLLFLVSQPRAGSTLLQKMLGAHSQIGSGSEPWFMLPLVYAFRKAGMDAAFDMNLARIGMDEFLADAGGEAASDEAIRSAALGLYARAARARQKRLFLDKTPRYYLILPELVRLFPGARFIMLYRNPLAVACSILLTWYRDRPERLFRNRDDLLDAPIRLLDAEAALGDRACRVGYEELVNDPEAVLSALCKDLDLPYEVGLCRRLPREPDASRLGDQQNARRLAEPRPELADRWEETLDDPQVWRLCDDYLTELGRERVEKMGYDPAALRETLDRHRPGWVDRKLTIPLALLLDPDLARRHPSARWKLRRWRRVRGRTKGSRA